MPRSSRSSGGRSAPMGSRSSSTMAAPRQAQPTNTQAYRQPSTAPPQQHHQQTAAAPSQGPGLFANMASTAAGVAVGSSIGHGISGMLFGGGGRAEAPVDQQQAQSQYPAYDQAAQQGAYQQTTATTCEAQAKDFTRCLEASGNDFQACSYYLEALKACQQAARPY
ncbi:hypothetical protein OC845_003976 [Tilletia horrida]|nr:hypothetical protein OC845_003976 [Tilletia horrida]